MKVAVFGSKSYEHLSRIVGHISAENIKMKKLSEEAGFRLRFDRKANECLAEIAR
jgi:hypothetical protein